MSYQGQGKDKKNVLAFSGKPDLNSCLFYWPRDETNDWSFYDSKARNTPKAMRRDATRGDATRGDAMRCNAFLSMPQKAPNVFQCE